MELKDCPFCGDSHVSRSIGMAANGADWPYIECEGCGATTEPDVWNRRSPSPAVGELAEVLRAYEQWEADLLLADECWKGVLPHISQALWDRFVGIQEKRNDALSTHSPKEMEQAQATPSARAADMEQATRGSAAFAPTDRLNQPE